MSLRKVAHFWNGICRVLLQEAILLRFGRFYLECGRKSGFGKLSPQGKRRRQPMCLRDKKALMRKWNFASLKIQVTSQLSRRDPALSTAPPHNSAKRNRKPSLVEETACLLKLCPTTCHRCTLAKFAVSRRTQSSNKVIGFKAKRVLFVFFHLGSNEDRLQRFAAAIPTETGRSVSKFSVRLTRTGCLTRSDYSSEREL